MAKGIFLLLVRLMLQHQIMTQFSKFFGSREQQEPADQLRKALRHRERGATLLSGHGLEVGALHYPLQIPRPDVTVEYLDVENAATLQTLFPELRAETVLSPHYIGDVSKRSVISITGRRFDFIILNHVLEHVPNPIQMLKHIWDALQDRGDLVISVPDKNFTFDRTRPLTSFNHLVADYFRGVSTVDDDHYIELLDHVQPDVFASKETLLQALQRARERREHVHVWDSLTFKAFLEKTFAVLGQGVAWRYESTGVDNHFEYFAVLQKCVLTAERRQAGLQVLLALYGDRPDLQHAFPAMQDEFPLPLLQWAVTAGVTIDSDATRVADHRIAYLTLIEQSEQKKLSVEELRRLFLAAQ